MPFVHSHKQNEELYIVLRGSGIFFVDGEEFPIAEGSLGQATLEDGTRLSTRTSWMKQKLADC